MPGWVKRDDRPKRITGWKLQKARERLFRANPLCVECEKVGRVTLAVQRDHINSLGKGGPDVDSNTQGLCLECHAKKTAKDTGREYRPKKTIGPDGWPTT